MTDLKVCLWTYLPWDIKSMFVDSFYDRFEGVSMDYLPWDIKSMFVDSFYDRFEGVSMDLLTVRQ
jgi:translation elongation factor EF-4